MTRSITGSHPFLMSKLTKINRGFFVSILSAFNDLDSSISEQCQLRKKESQLLPLIYFTCLILLLSQLIQVTSEVQKDPYISIVTALVVSYFFFLPIFLYIFSFILYLVLKMFGGMSSIFQTRLALFWSLSISTSIILLISIIKIFLSGIAEDLVVIASELLVVYIFSRMISFVSCFKDRNLFTLTVTSIYLAQVMLVYSR